MSKIVAKCEEFKNKFGVFTLRRMSNWIKEIYKELNFANLSLEQATFFLVSVSGIFMSVVGVIGNSALNLGMITIVIPATNIVLNTIYIIYAVKTKKWFIPAVLVASFATFILFPFLWFSTGGATGSTMPYLLMAGFIVVIMFQGKIRTLILVATPVVFSIFIFLEMLYPDICIPYPSRQAHYIDLIIGLVTSFLATMTMAVIVLSRYRKAELESKELVRQLGELSVIDPLTEVYNRRMLTSSLQEEMRKCYENGEALTICLLDIDHFKQVNDVYGHLCGDEVLVTLARILKESVSECDMVGRYGGEEFFILLKGQPLDRALKTIEKLHKAIPEHDWQDVCTITISCGVSEYAHGMSYSDFLRTADHCLYKAKEAGRNQIVSRGAGEWVPPTQGA